MPSKVRSPPLVRDRFCELIHAHICTLTLNPLRCWRVEDAGNLPEEIPWYLTRMNNGWGFVGLLVVLGHFVLPFALLLSRDLKRNFKLLAYIAVFVLLMRFVDLYWVIVPTFRTTGFGISFLDLTTININQGLNSASSSDFAYAAQGGGASNLISINQDGTQHTASLWQNGSSNQVCPICVR